MQTIEIPQKDWTRALDEFSALHEGAFVSLDVLGATVGAQHQVHSLPLRGVTAETGSRRPSIMITAAPRDGEEITHVVAAPSHVRIERNNDGGDVSLQIESRDGTAAILHIESAR